MSLTKIVIIWPPRPISLKWKRFAHLRWRSTARKCNFCGSQLKKVTVLRRFVENRFDVIVSPFLASWSSCRYKKKTLKPRLVSELIEVVYPSKPFSGHTTDSLVLQTAVYLNIDARTLFFNHIQQHWSSWPLLLAKHFTCQTKLNSGSIRY